MEKNSSEQDACSVADQTNLENQILINQLVDLLSIEEEVPSLQQNFKITHKSFTKKFSNFHGRLKVLDAQVTSVQEYRVKSVCIPSFSSPYFPVFRLNTERYSVSVRI